MSSSKAYVSDMSVEVKPRRMSFPFKRTRKRFFFDNNPVKSVFWAALSATFPAGEKEFIDSVRLFKDQVKDPELLDQVKGFIGQEGHHSGQHMQMNKQLRDLGLDAVRLEKHLERDIKKFVPSRPNRERLAMTVGMEHITAIMADHALNNPEVFDGMDPTIRDLLLWHAVEEIEHKAVAFDVFMLCDGDQKYLHKTMKVVIKLFVIRIFCYMIGLLWWSRSLPRWRDIKGFYKMLYGEKGIITCIKSSYRDYFRDGFHPWDHQNQALVDMWKEKFYDEKYDRGSDKFERDLATVDEVSSETVTA